MVTNVTSLLKTVKTVEDEAARGTRALESTIEAIGQEIKVRLPVSVCLLFFMRCSEFCGLVWRAIAPFVNLL